MEIREASEGLTSTVEHVNSGVSQLASNASAGSEKSVQIKGRAVKIKENGIESKALAEQIYAQYLNSPNVVNTIGSLLAALVGDKNILLYLPITQGPYA